MRDGALPSARQLRCHATRSAGRRRRVIVAAGLNSENHAGHNRGPEVPRRFAAGTCPRSGRSRTLEHGGPFSSIAQARPSRHHSSALRADGTMWRAVCACCPGELDEDRNVLSQIQSLSRPDVAARLSASGGGYSPMRLGWARSAGRQQDRCHPHHVIEPQFVCNAD